MNHGFTSITNFPTEILQKSLIYIFNHEKFRFFVGKIEKQILGKVGAIKFLCSGKMDRIKISFDEMMNIVKDYGALYMEHPEYLQHIYDNGFIFNEFTLIWENMYIYKVYIRGKGEEQVFHVKKIVTSKGRAVKRTNADFTLLEYLENHAESFKNIQGLKPYQYTKEMIDKSWSADYLPVIAFMQYVVYKSMNREVIYKEQTTRKYKNHSRNNKSESKEYKLIDVVRKYEHHINHSKHNMTCKCWPVRGHERHYKSGKVTWIDPYPKGPERDKVIPSSKKYRV